MPDNEELLRTLGQLDLDNMTIGQIRAVDNPVLRRALLNAVNQVTPPALEHTSHGMHTSHAKASALDIPFGDPIAQVDVDNG